MKIMKLGYARCGSSPRMRGKRKNTRRSFTSPGLVPAHAGKTWGYSPTVKPEPAHPRACGENFQTLPKMSLTEGSSPRMRGKRKNDHMGGWTGRLIPAHAGKTIRPSLSSSDVRAHPRACGENAVPPKPIANEPGSSPRMRGKRHDPGVDWTSAGLIPAHAGKTISLDFLRKNSGAHPRACGENFDLATHFIDEAGSSPRMRGKRIVMFKCGKGIGLIPAHAGKTIP